MQSSLSPFLKQKTTMKFKIFILGILSLSLFCCNGKEDSVVNFGLKRSEFVNLSDIFIVEKQLKIKNKKPISPIKKVSEIKNEYLALVGSNIAKIDSEGSIYKLMINNENSYKFKGITSFDVFNDKIYTLERKVGKLKVIDEDFNVLEEHLIPFYPLSFKVISEEEVLFYLGFQKYETQTYQLVLFNFKKGSVVKSFYPVEDNLNYFNVYSDDNLFLSNGVLHYFNGLDNAVYSYKDTTFKKVKTFDYGSKSLPNDFYKSSKFGDVQEYIEKMNSMDNVSRFYSLKLLDDYLIKHVSYGDQRYIVLKNLKSDKEFCTQVIKEDIINSNDIGVMDEDESFVGIVGNQLAIYIENNNYEKDSSFVCTLLFGRFKF